MVKKSAKAMISEPVRDDVVFDFQHILKKREQSKKQEDHQASDARSTIKNMPLHSFFSLFRNEQFFILLLILIPLFFGVYVRSAPAWVPQAESMAQKEILSSFAQEQLSTLQKTNPALSDDDKKRVIYQRVATFQKSDEFETQVEAFKKQLKEPYKDASGFLYLIGADSYQYARYIRNVVDHGYPGDTLKDGRQFDTLMLAPTGKAVTNNLHVYAGAYFYMIASLFLVNASLEGILFFFPVFVSALAIIFAFYVGRKLGGNIAGFFTALFIAVHYAAAARTMGGLVDTDVYTIFFPLAIVWFYFEMITAESLRKKLLFAGGAGVFTGLFAFAWTGWWYIYNFLLIATVVYLCYQFVTFCYQIRHVGVSFISFFKTKHFIHLFYSMLVYILITGLLVFFFKRLKNVFDPYTSVLDFLSFGEAVKGSSLWPNVLLTIKELEQVNFDFIIDAVGGWLIFFTLLGALFLLYQGFQRHRQISIKRSDQELSQEPSKNPFIFYVLFLFVYTIGSLFAIKSGIRFLIVLITPVALLSSYFLSSAILSLSNLAATFFPFFSKHYQRLQSFFVIILCFGVLLFLGLIPFSSLCFQGACEQTLEGIRITGPTIDDHFVDVLKGLQTRTAEDAILTSWWDYGHIFKHFTQRAVTFDGASQNTPQAYFVGRFFMADNEKEALGILRMLNCGGNATVSLLESEFSGDTRRAVELVNKLVVASKKEGRVLLEKEGIPPPSIQRILSTTYCQPPESYVIVTKDVVGKVSAWGHIGLWNFTRAKMLQDVQPLTEKEGVLQLQNTFGFSQEQAEKTQTFLQTASSSEIQEWLAPWVLYSKDIVACKIAGKDSVTLLCPNYLNEEEGGIYEVSFTPLGDIGSAVAKNQQGSSFVPQSVVFMRNNELFEYRTPFADKKKSPFSIALVKTATGINSFVLSPQLSLGVFTRLSYYNGAGLSHFKLFTAGEGYNPMLVWKVSWPDVEE